MRNDDSHIYYFLLMWNELWLHKRWVEMKNKRLWGLLIQSFTWKSVALFKVLSKALSGARLMCTFFPLAQLGVLPAAEPTQRARSGVQQTPPHHPHHPKPFPSWSRNGQTQPLMQMCLRGGFFFCAIQTHGNKAVGAKRVSQPWGMTPERKPLLLPGCSWQPVVKLSPKGLT